MCLSQLLVLVSTLPIGIVMCGPQGPEDQSVSSMNFFDGRPRAQGVNEVARKARHGSQGLLALSTLAAALVLSFLIMRCFIALSPRGNIKQDSGASSRRLSYIPNACSQENLIEDEKDLEKQKKENRSLLKMGLIFGGTIITGLATMAAVYVVTEARKIAAITGAVGAGGAAAAIGEAAANGIGAIGGAAALHPSLRARRSALETRARERLSIQLPSKRVTLKVTHTFDVEKLNQLLVENFLASALDKTKDEAMIKREFNEFVKYFVEADFKRMFATDFSNLSAEMKRAAELIEDDYAKSIGLMMVTAESLRRAEPEEVESLLEPARERLSIQLPTKPVTLIDVHIFDAEKLNQRIANYFLTLDLTDEAMMKKEFNEFVKYSVEAEFERMFATDFANLSAEMKNKAAEIRADYATRFGIMTATADSLRRAEPEKEKEKEKEKEELMIHLPTQVGPKDLPQRIANYFLALDEEKLNNDAMRIELTRYAKYYLKAYDGAATIPNFIDHYVKRISMMVAATERRHRATREAIKHVTATVANTVKAIEEGTFKF